MQTYYCDDGNAKIKIEADSPKEAAQEYVMSGDWGVITKTTWIKVAVWSEVDENEDAEWHTITLDPIEPECSESKHDWRSPYSLLGGLKENPGVYGHGGGVVTTRVCKHCGTYRIADTWAQNPETGEQGLWSVEYKAPDDESLAWVEGN
jgi:hypothetical protein